MIEIIRDCLTSWHRDAMRAGGAEPQHLAASRVTLQGDVGNMGNPCEALHVVAGDLDTGRAWTMAVLDLALGAEDFAACLAEELTNLTDSKAVRSVIAPPDRLTRDIVRQTLDMTPGSIPGFAATMGHWRREAPGCGEFDVFAGAVGQFDQRLKGLAREGPLTVEHLEGRALIRQGYGAHQPALRRLGPPKTGAALITTAARRQNWPL